MMSFLTSEIFLLGLLKLNISQNIKIYYQLAITCSKLTVETREQGVKYVQS